MSLECCNRTWLDIFYTLSPCSMQQHAMWRARTALWWRNESVWADVANVDTKSRTVLRISRPTFVDLVALAEMMTATAMAFGNTLRTSWLTSTTSGTPNPVVTGGLMAVLTVMEMTRTGGALATMRGMMITGALLETTTMTVGGHLVTTMAVTGGGLLVVIMAIPGGISKAMVIAPLVVVLSTPVLVAVQLKNLMVAIPRPSQWPLNLERRIVLLASVLLFWIFDVPWTCSSENNPSLIDIFLSLIYHETWTLIFVNTFQQFFVKKYAWLNIVNYWILSSTNHQNVRVELVIRYQFHHLLYKGTNLPRTIGWVRHMCTYAYIHAGSCMYIFCVISPQWRKYWCYTCILYYIKIWTSHFFIPWFFCRYISCAYA